MTMRSTMTTASTLTTLFVAVGLAMAQTPPQSPATDARGTRPADGAGTTVHATGCLEIGNAAAASPTGTDAATGSAAGKSALATYVLTGARIGGMAVATSAAATDETTGDARKTDGALVSETATRLRIVGLGAGDLQPHVKQQVEIEGRLQMPAGDTATVPESGGAVGTPENTRTTGTPGTTGTTGSGTTSSPGTAHARADAPAAMPAAPSFIATSIRPIAANCIGGSN